MIVSAYVYSVHEVGGVRGVWRAVFVNHLLTITVVGSD